jgi:sulfide dehydrogenase [flavocytochrome c] flavoprotein subunit
MTRDTTLSRRSALRLIGGAGASAGLFALSAPAVAQGSAGRVVVVGGGFGGATTAKYLKRANPKIQVTLV